MYKKFFKRFIDVVLSGLALLILWLPMLIVAIIVKCDSKGPVFFWQKRVGLHKETFMMPKFRSMYTETPANMPTHMLADPDQWITKAGRILRKTSLDELPELINIWLGQMAIVGPRPLLPSYLPLYNERQRHRHDVRPGLTGYAQVHGRNAVTWEQRFEMDLHYVQRITFWGDVKILLSTVAVVFKRSGISDGECATKEPFQGTPPACEDGENLTQG